MVQKVHCSDFRADGRLAYVSERQLALTSCFSEYHETNSGKTSLPLLSKPTFCHTPLKTAVWCNNPTEQSVVPHCVLSKSSDQSSSEQSREFARACAVFFRSMLIFRTQCSCSLLRCWLRPLHTFVLNLGQTLVRERFGKPQGRTTHHRDPNRGGQYFLYHAPLLVAVLHVLKYRSNKRNLNHLCTFILNERPTNHVHCNKQNCLYF